MVDTPKKQFDERDGFFDGLSEVKTIAWLLTLGDGMHNFLGKIVFLADECKDITPSYGCKRSDVLYQENTHKFSICRVYVVGSTGLIRCYSMKNISIEFFIIFTANR